MARLLDTTGPSDARPPWRPRDVAIATVGTLVAFVVLVGVAVGISAIGDERGVGSFPVWALAAFYIVLIAMVWNFSVRKYRAGWRTLGFRAPASRWSFALAAAVLLASLLLIGAYRLATDHLPVTWLRPGDVPPEVFGYGLERVANGFAVVVVAPFAEEMFFRGFVLGGLAAAFGDPRAIFVSSALFAAMHASVGTFIPLLMAGMLLGWLYLRTRSIWPPIAVHSAQNALAILSPG